MDEANSKHNNAEVVCQKCSDTFQLKRRLEKNMIEKEVYWNNKIQKLAEDCEKKIDFYEMCHKKELQKFCDEKNSLMKQMDALEIQLKVFKQKQQLTQQLMKSDQHTNDLKECDSSSLFPISCRKESLLNIASASPMPTCPDYPPAPSFETNESLPLYKPNSVLEEVMNATHLVAEVPTLSKQAQMGSLDGLYNSGNISPKLNNTSPEKQESIGIMLYDEDNLPPGGKSVENIFKLINDKYFKLYQRKVFCVASDKKAVVVKVSPVKAGRDAADKELINNFQATLDENKGRMFHVVLMTSDGYEFDVKFLKNLQQSNIKLTWIRGSAPNGKLKKVAQQKEKEGLGSIYTSKELLRSVPSSEEKVKGALVTNLPRLQRLNDKEVLNWLKEKLGNEISDSDRITISGIRGFMIKSDQEHNTNKVINILQGEKYEGKLPALIVDKVYKVN
ncbi:uncharacterized protein LOC143466102 [Clavelina lepadiformis]|uniref:uncharacterized protein LOC143466102 n=1 Tax=Clavelina lepadiformis TaxID=159417 RepID=UPI004042D3EB